MSAPALDRDAIEAFLRREYPHAGFKDGRLVLADYVRGHCRVLLPLDERNIRPGPSVSGPAMMLLADISAWIALLSVIAWLAGLRALADDLWFVFGAGFALQGLAVVHWHGNREFRRARTPDLA